MRGANESHYNLVGRRITPTIDVELVDFGVRIYTVRQMDADKSYLRVSYFILPNLSAFPGQTGGEGYSVNWHVPIDDSQHWKYAFIYSSGAPLDKAVVARERSELTSDYRLIRNTANRFLQDREAMKTKTYAGMGHGFQAHDAFATAARERSRTGRMSTSFPRTKRSLRRASCWRKPFGTFRKGRDPAHVARDPSQNRFPHLLVISDMIPNTSDWKDYTKELELEARAKM